MTTPASSRPTAPGAASAPAPIGVRVASTLCWIVGVLTILVNVAVGIPVISAGAIANVGITLKNTGATAWRKGTPQEARLGIRDNRTDLTYLADGWPTADRPAVQAEDIVPPGGIATFTFTLRASAPGTYRLNLRGVIDGGAWMDDLGLFTMITVRNTPGRLGVQ